MARGYLGKISAVISANNGSYVRALNDSAAKTKNFANTIQNDLKRASADASKSLNGILTPLQRIERAIQNAVSQRLSFRGFEGAIRTVRDLEKSLASLSDQEVRVVLKTTGAESIEQVKRAVSGLQQTDVDLFVNLVGGEKSIAELRRLISTADANNGKVIGLKAEVDVAEARRLEDVLTNAGIGLRKLQAAGEAVNNIRADAAAASFRSLLSVSEQIGRPLSEAATQFGGLSLEVQAKFIPALNKAQQGVQNLERDIDAKLPIAEKRFEGVRAAAERAAIAISRLSEANRLSASGATGDELAFVSPGVRNELLASSSLANQVAESADPSRFRAEVQQLASLRAEILKINADVEADRIFRIDTTESEAKLRDFIARSAEVRNSIEQATAVPARGFTLQQAPQEQRGLGLFGSQAGTDTERAVARARVASAEFEKLPKAAQAGLQGLAGIASRVADGVAAGTSNAQQLNAVLDRLEDSIRSVPPEIVIDIDAKSLQADAIDLARKTRQEFDAIVNSLPAGSQPRVAIESAAAAAPPGSPPSDDLRRQAEEAAERFKALGLAIDDPARRIEVLRGSIVSLKGQLDQLPAPVQDLLVPALNRAEAEFQRLKNSGTATAAEISRASLAVQDLKNRASSVSRLDSFATFLGKRSGTGAEVLVRDFEAVNRAVDFFKVNLLGVRAPIEAWRTALQAAIADGTAGVPAVAKQLEILRRTAVETAAATAGIDTNRFLNTARNFGDVGRAGADKFSLALNQLAFVFDDLTSASGGLDMKFRAIQNNLTQIGFILGSTTGLWLALSAAIGGQIIIAITKFVLQTDLQQAKLKELNEALKAQQNAVESLAKAYADLGNEIAKSGASGPQARELDRESRVRGVKEIQDERNRQEAVSLSPEVAEIRGRRGLLEERLQNERNLQRRVQIQNEIERNRRQEAAAVARGVTPPSADDVQNQLVAAEEERVRQTQIRLNRARLRRRLGGADPPGEDVATLTRELDQRTADLRARRAAPAAAGQREQLTQLRSSLADLEQQRAGVVASGARTTEIDQAIDDVTTSIRRIEASLAPEVQKVVRSIISKSLSIGETLGQAQSFIADALGDSAEARSLRREIAVESRNVARLVESVETATTPEEAREREAELSAARRRAAGLRSRAQAVQAQAIIDPQALFDNVRARVERNLQNAGAPSGLLARRSRELQARRAALLQDLDSEDPLTRLRAERALPALGKEVRALEAATLQVNAFSQALARAEQEVASNLQSAQQRADETRRRDLRLGTPETGEERRIAEQEFREQQEVNRRAEETFRLERDRLEREAEEERGPLTEDFKRLREIDDEIAADPFSRVNREELEAERRRIQTRIDAAVEASPAVQAARDESTRTAERQDLGRRGRDLILSSGEREARELSDNLEALRIEFGRQAEEGTGLIDQAGLAREQRRLVEESQRRIAPLAFQFSDEIANAVLQGPSRAALGATDASTVQGQAELNRLLRGDDSARDVNLVELEKQTEELRKLNEKLPFPVAEA